MILLLIRHGLTDVTGKKLTGWLPGFSLSEKGREQALDAGLRLAETPLKAVYSSPLERCRETAEAVAEPHSLSVHNVRQLGEVHYGDWQGRTMKALYKSKAWADLKARPADFRFPGGETIREAQTRGITAIEGLRPKHKGQVVAVCSHADMIRLIVAGYLGLGLDLYSRISIAPVSVTALVLENATPHLVRLGDTGSFDGIGLVKPRKTRRPTGATTTAAPKKTGRVPTVPLEGS
ncbi:MAG: MSMEG_4193 family putative phosphomutase [Actinomycetota bacterium]